MDQAILAWGGYMLLFLLILWIVSRFCGKNVDRGEKQELSVFLEIVYVGSGRSEWRLQRKFGPGIDRI